MALEGGMMIAGRSDDKEENLRDTQGGSPRPRGDSGGEPRPRAQADEKKSSRLPLARAIGFLLACVVARKSAADVKCAMPRSDPHPRRGSASESAPESEGCERLALPRPMGDIPLSPGAYERDRGRTHNFIMAREGGYLMAVPNWEVMARRVDRRTGEFRSYNNGGVRARAAASRPDDGIFIDVGGWVGDTALPSAARGIDTFVFEPVRKNADMIHLSVLANECDVSRHMRVVNSLVGARDSANETVYVSSLREDNAAFSKEQAVGNVGENEGDYAQPVEMVALDSFFPPGTRAQNLKIDVQGYELQVLMGAERLLKENKGRLWVCFEYDPGLLKSAGTQPEALMKYMKDIGYEQVSKTRDGDIVMK